MLLSRGYFLELEDSKLPRNIKDISKDLILMDLELLSIITVTKVDL